MKETTRKAFGYLIIIAVQRGAGIALYGLASGWAYDIRATLYFIIYFFSAVLSTLLLFFTRRDLLAERGKRNTNSPLWDKILLSFFWLLAYFGVYYAAGLGASAGFFLDNIFWAGILLYTFSAILALWALMVNPFLESTARLQGDRGQTVCQEGPYRWVRHPTYLSLIIWCLAVVLIFFDFGTHLCLLLIAGILIVRTILEDKMLRQGLSGYEQYAQKVPWRLIPFVW